MYESRIYTATVAIKREGPGTPDLLNECMRVTNFLWNCFDNEIVSTDGIVRIYIIEAS